jgi:hypothetical protein
MDGNWEVWRRLCDFPSFSSGALSDAEDYIQYVVPKAHPTSAMRYAGEAVEASRLAEPIDAKHNYEARHLKRGFFRPWAHLILPRKDLATAYRLSDNFILGVASHERVYLFDVRSGKLVQTIDNIQQIPKTYSNAAQKKIGNNFMSDTNTSWQERSNALGKISYIDHNNDFVFLCGRVSIRVYSRKLGGKCVLDMRCDATVGSGLFRLGDPVHSLDSRGQYDWHKRRIIDQDIQYCASTLGSSMRTLRNDTCMAGK